MNRFYMALFGLLVCYGGSAIACSSHGTQEGTGIKVEYSDPDDLGRIKVRLGIESTLVEPTSVTTCVAGLGMGSADRPLDPDVNVLSVQLEVINRATGAVRVLEHFAFEPDQDTADGMARGSTSSSPDPARPIIDGAAWFGFSAAVEAFVLALAEGESVQIMFEIDMPGGLLPLLTNLQFAAGEGLADGSPVFDGEHPVAYFSGIGTGVILSLFRINAGLNDAWVTGGAAFQGFFFTIFEQLELLFLSWFTFDAEAPGSAVTSVFGAPDQRWVTATGRFAGNSVTLSVELTSGGVFNTSTPLATQEAGYGSISIFFRDCALALISYQFTSLGLSGEMMATRVLEDNISVCEALAGP